MTLPAQLILLTSIELQGIHDVLPGWSFHVVSARTVTRFAAHAERGVFARPASTHGFFRSAETGRVAAVALRVSDLCHWHFARLPGPAVGRAVRVPPEVVERPDAPLFVRHDPAHRRCEPEIADLRFEVLLPVSAEHEDQRIRLIVGRIIPVDQRHEEPVLLPRLHFFLVGPLDFEVPIGDLDVVEVRHDNRRVSLAMDVSVPSIRPRGMFFSMTGSAAVGPDEWAALDPVDYDRRACQRSG